MWKGREKPYSLAREKIMAAGLSVGLDCSKKQ